MPSVGTAPASSKAALKIARNKRILVIATGQPRSVGSHFFLNGVVYYTMHTIRQDVQL